MNAPLNLRSLLGGMALVVALAACGSDAPEVIALSYDAPATVGLEETILDSSELLIEPELVSSQAEGAAVTTTTTAPAVSTTSAPEVGAPVVDAPTTTVAPAATTTTTTATTTITAAEPAIDVCVRGADFPQFEGAVQYVDADMDGDGEVDQVYLLADSNGLGSDGWVAVTYANGGIATGKFDGFFEITPDPGLTVGELTNGSGTSPEIIFTASSGPSIEHVVVMTVIDCQVVTTMLFDDAFSFNRGAGRGYTSTAGCAYGTGGRIEFDVTEANPNVGDWTTTVYTLEEATWTQVGRYSKSDFPDLDSPEALTMQDCAGLIVGE